MLLPGWRPARFPVAAFSSLYGVGIHLEMQTPGTWCGIESPWTQMNGRSWNLRENQIDLWRNARLPSERRCLRGHEI